MGKGDQRSRRGKIWRGTFGKRRPRKSNRVPQTSVAGPPAEEKKARPKKEAAASE